MYRRFVAIVEYCPPLNAPVDGGTLTVDGYKVNDEAMYDCNAGYRIEQNSPILTSTSRACTPQNVTSGVWIPEEEPSCMRT